MNNPALVNELLMGQKELTATVEDPESNNTNEMRVEFRRSGKNDDEWVAGIFFGGKPVVRRSRRIALDFDILDGFYDLLYLLAAFAAPDKNILFQIQTAKEEEKTVEESYLVYYKKEEDDSVQRSIKEISA